MSGWEYLALGLVLWTALGVLGLAISVARRERKKLKQGVASLAGVWVVYVAVLLAVSYRQPDRRVARGRPLCFHALCYTVERVEELAGFPARNGERLVRVTVRVENHDGGAAEEEVRAYLVDAAGRRWAPSAGIAGNSLGARVPGHGTVVSEPVFRVEPEARGLALGLTHGRWTWHRMVIGDAESWGHRARLLDLEREAR